MMTLDWTTSLFQITKLENITSECDPIVPVSHGAKASSLIGNSTHVTLSGVGHLALLEDPETFAASIGDFLR